MNTNKIYRRKDRYQRRPEREQAPPREHSWKTKIREFLCLRDLTQFPLVINESLDAIKDFQATTPGMQEITLAHIRNQSWTIGEEVPKEAPRMCMLCKRDRVMKNEIMHESNDNLSEEIARIGWCCAECALRFETIDRLNCVYYNAIESQRPHHDVRELEEKVEKIFERLKEARHKKDTFCGKYKVCENPEFDPGKPQFCRGDSSPTKHAERANAVWTATDSKFVHAQRSELITASTIHPSAEDFAKKVLAEDFAKEAQVGDFANTVRLGLSRSTSRFRAQQRLRRESPFPTVKTPLLDQSRSDLLRFRQTTKRAKIRSIHGEMRAQPRKRNKIVYFCPSAKISNTLLCPEPGFTQTIAESSLPSLNSCPV